MDIADAMLDFAAEYDGPFYVVRERCYICGRITIAIFPEGTNTKRLECGQCHGRTSRIVRYYGAHGKRYVKHAGGR